jgi:uncharacterized membrane protein
MDLMEWLNLLARWAHVFAGILWVGQTYFFTWLDGRFEDAERNPGGNVWMVHSGGFYLVKKLKAPETMPPTLYWFRWEAALTWLTGLLLLGIVYYAGGLMIDATGAEVPLGRAAGLGLGLLVVGWLVYDGLWRSPLARFDSAAVAIAYVLLVGLAYALTHTLSGRPAFMMVGAVLGTLMAANVWLRILPAQRALVAATRAGTAPDLALASRAKQRSKHNTYMVVPLVFIMLSNHYPTASYGRADNWIILAALVLAGWAAAWVLRRH